MVVELRSTGAGRRTSAAVFCVGVGLASLVVTTLSERVPLPTHDVTPTMGPQDVVRVQVEALRDNALLGADRGIAVAWQLASPENRHVTGPLPRFTALVKGPVYGALVDAAEVELGAFALNSAGNAATQAVTVRSQSGAEHRYLFDVRLTNEGWRTDTVSLVGAPPVEDLHVRGCDL